MLVNVYLWNTDKFPDCMKVKNVNGANAQMEVKNEKELLSVVAQIGGAILYPPEAPENTWLLCVGHRHKNAKCATFRQR